MAKRACAVALLGVSLVAWQGQAPSHSDKVHLLFYQDAKGEPHPVRTPAEWKVRQKQILANMELVMGRLPERKNSPLDVVVLEEVRLDTCTRKKLTFISEDGDRVPVYLFMPSQRHGRGPAVLCLHQTTAIGKAEPAGLGGNPNLHYALELAERGYVTLTPDYPKFGDYKTDPYALGYVSGTIKGIYNHMRAVDLLESLPDVDPKRIGVIGHSLGGHNALFLATFDARIKAVVSSCGFTSFEKYKGGDLSGWSTLTYMPRIASVYHKSPAEMPFDFTEVLGALAPRPAFISAPLQDTNFEVTGVDDCVAAAMPVYRRIFHAEDRMVVKHPNCGHDVPADIRRQAYEFLDRWLGP